MRTVIIVLAAGWAAFGLTTTARGDDAPQAEVLRLREENAALRRRVAELEAKLAAMGAAVEQAETRSRRLAEQVAEVEAEHAAEQQREAVFLTRSYDAATKRTRIVSRSMPMVMTAGPARHHALLLSVEFAERAPSEPIEAVTLHVAAQFSGGVYREVETLKLIAGERVFACRVTAYDSVFRRVGSPRNRQRKDDENFTVAVPAEALAAIGEAERATGELGGSRFELTAEQRGAFAAMAGAIDR